ncbi:MAG: phosphatase PAP2 family protein [archaeon]|nr:phosphatase PAP2 family protein [archaeon]
MKKKKDFKFKRTIAKGINTLFRDITALGGAPFFVLIILVAISLKEYRLFQDLLIGFLITLFVVVVTRLIYFKNRPLKQSYNNLLERLDASSFPSLHAARILFLTLTLANYFQDRIITVLFLIIAATVSYSRIYLKKHDWIDVIVGLVLGGITYYFLIY